MLALVFQLIAIGTYKLFINPEVKTPEWLDISNLDDLKNKLVRVIVLVMAVSFLTEVIEGEPGIELTQLGVGIAVLAIIVDGSPMLGLVVMLAMWGNQVVAGFAGAFVPATLDRIGVDPSVASSVFVHTLTDLCGFFLLLGLASKLLLN